MTYKNCKRLYELKKASGGLTEAFAAKQLENLDIFLLNERITGTEYNELIDMLKIEDGGQVNG